jgi:hypothetical protein
MRLMIEWPGNTPPPKELINPLVINGAKVTELPQTHTLGLPNQKPVSPDILGMILDASLASKAHPVKEVMERLGRQIREWRLRSRRMPKPWFWGMPDGWKAEICPKAENDSLSGWKPKSIVWQHHFPTLVHVLTPFFGPEIWIFLPVRKGIVAFEVMEDKMIIRAFIHKKQMPSLSEFQDW